MATQLLVEGSSDDELSSLPVVAGIDISRHLGGSPGVIYHCPSLWCSPLWQPLPRLPALRSVDLAVQTKWPQHPSWLVTALSSLIASSHATIKEINILYHVSPGPFLLHFFDTDISAQLNKVLSDAAHPLRMCWQLRFERANEAEVHLFHFTAFVRAELLPFRERGDLIVERYPVEDQRSTGEWALVDTAMYSHISKCSTSNLLADLLYWSRSSKHFAHATQAKATAAKAPTVARPS
ncbi:hypothetical protein C8R43DRAFT_1128211 [Mycena crocata]|nr:hypothetical protein C8R43DRAFT_1128211 [Mycena crocata]